MSVAVLIINIYNPRAVTLYLIKHRITNKGRFYRYKVAARDVLSTIW